MGLGHAQCTDVAEPTPEPDEQLIRLWLNGRGVNTQRAYGRDVEQFRTFIGKALRDVTLADLQFYAEHLDRRDLRPASRHRALSAVKSLYAFGARLRYFPFDVAQPLRLPDLRDPLSERILEEEEVRKLIAGANDPRNRIILELLYVAGVRVSELIALTWRDVRPHRGAGQITVFGKGGKTRTIRVEGESWTTLQTLRAEASPADPVFLSRKGGHLDPSAVWRVVKAAAKTAGIESRVSPHWLRHCHASHALDNGAPIHLVQATLGHANIATTSKYLHVRPNESSGKYLPKL